MAEIKKAAPPLWAVTQEETASIHPDKDEVNLNPGDNLSMVKNQQGSTAKVHGASKSRWMHIGRNPILYAGVLFGSEQEVLFAKWCNDNQQQYLFEPEIHIGNSGYRLSGLFFLPEPRTIVKVRPTVYTGKTYTIDNLFTYPDFDDFGLVVVDMVRDFRVIKYSDPGYDIIGWVEFDEFEFGRTWEDEEDLYAGFCNKCSAFGVCGNSFSWACNACGNDEGDQTFSYEYGGCAL